MMQVPSIVTNSKQLLRVVVLIATILYITLAIGSALTETPSIDEGMFASPALNLATKGSMGTTVLESVGSTLTRIHQRTYWVMPLHLLNQAVWYKVFGFSLFSMRSLSIIWGIVALLSWALIMRALFDDRRVALVTSALLALDYIFIKSASAGRMDMMTAALGFAAFAAYLSLRERNLAAAILASQSLVVASGLTHFNGIIPFVGLIFLTLYHDRHRINWRHVAIATVPYLIGGFAYGLYIMQDLEAFRAQFIANAVMGNRLGGFSSPLTGLIQEFTQRYPQSFGLGQHTSGHSGPIYLKSLILLAYVAALLATVLTPSLRKHKGYRTLLVLTVIYFLIMAVLDGQKQHNYMIHIVPFYVAILAVWLRWCWTNRAVPHMLILFFLCVYLLLQVGGIVYRMKQNTYQNRYMPVIKFLQDNTNQTTSIVGSSALGFGLRFPDNLIDDPRFGHVSGKRPDIIVFGQENEQSLQEAQIWSPHLYEHVTRLLSQDYHQIYDNGSYKVYARQ